MDTMDWIVMLTVTALVGGAIGWAIGWAIDGWRERKAGER